MLSLAKILDYFPLFLAPIQYQKRQFF